MTNHNGLVLAEGEGQEDEQGAWVSKIRDPIPTHKLVLRPNFFGQHIPRKKFFPTPKNYDVNPKATRRRPFAKKKFHWFQRAMAYKWAYGLIREVTKSNVIVSEQKKRNAHSCKRFILLMHKRNNNRAAQSWNVECAVKRGAWKF